MLDDERDSWKDRDDGAKEGLVLFSGDLFSPSVESSVTRGSHMVPVINAISPDVSMTGNHDFDFGWPHLSNLIRDTTFPWLLSNVIDTRTSKTPEQLREFHVLERAGIRIGVIGLIEKEWIATISSWPAEFKYNDAVQVGIDLSQKLRDPEGEYKCDIILALTHARIPNDIKFAKALAAHSPAFQKGQSTAQKQGVDLIMGGHDHLYYISKGATSWEGYDLQQKVLGAEADEGDVLVVKSGTDFRDLSSFVLELEDTPEGSVRKKLIKSIRGKYLQTKPECKKSERLAKLLEDLLSSVGSTLKAPIGKTEVELDCRSSVVRLDESAAGNWFADVLRHAYDGALCMKGCGGSDGVFICGGTIRGDSIYGPGNISLGDIMEILPFEDPIVVLELDGEAIWAALEAALSTFPAQEGRFPIVSGFRVVWDSTLPPGKRVKGVWLIQEPSGSATNTPADTSGTTTPIASVAKGIQWMNRQAPLLTDVAEVKRQKGGQTYKIVTREYMAQGHDGFAALKGHPYLVDDEAGQMMSTIVRKYLLGSKFVRRLSRAEHPGISLLHPESTGIVSREHVRESRFEKTSAHKETAHKWKHAAHLAMRWSRAHYTDTIGITEREHMSPVDCFNGEFMRNGKVGGSSAEDDKDLLVIHPIVDGRLHDEGRE